MRIAFTLFALLGAACDSKAKASDPQAHMDKAKELESCSTSSQCADDLRCFDRECRRTTRSTVGDYFAALGANVRAKGDIEAAIDAYSRALGHYDTEKLAAPPDVDCAYGAALAAGKSNKQHAELGARVLHRCLLALPVGSSLRKQALADLATLADNGLDPLALGRTQLADVYLTRDATPSSDKLTVTFGAVPPPAAKSYQGVTDALAAPEVKSALVACWQAYNNAAHKDTMVDAISIKGAYTPSQYEDETGSFAMKIDPPGALPAGTPEAAADQCVRGVVEPVLKNVAVRDAFQTRLTVTVK
jgi:hypothetical protein